MRLWLSPEGNVASVSPAGELDLATAEVLRLDLLEASRLANRLVVCDLAEVSFLDSLALGCIVAAATRCRGSGKDLVVMNASPSCEKVITLMGAGWLLGRPGRVPADDEAARARRT